MRSRSSRSDLGAREAVLRGGCRARCGLTPGYGPVAELGMTGLLRGATVCVRDRHHRSMVQDRTAATPAPIGRRRSSAMHSSLIGKVEKANRYARELDRI